jgi:hypothetical protein
LACLHPGIIDTEGKIPIPDLQRGGLVVDQLRPDDIVLGHDALPTGQFSVQIKSLKLSYTYRSIRPRTVAGKIQTHSENGLARSILVGVPF